MYTDPPAGSSGREMANVVKTPSREMHLSDGEAPVGISRDVLAFWALGILLGAQSTPEDGTASRNRVVISE